MPFDSGSVTFVVCRLQEKLSDDILEDFIRCKARSTDEVKDEPQLGWVTGRHLLDTRITEETAYMGGYLHLYLRTAVRKIPSSLLSAECRIEELALQQANNNMEVTRRIKKQIKEEVVERLLDQMPPTLSGIPFVYDQNENLLYVGTATQSSLDSFLAFFRDTTGIEAYPMTAEHLLLDEFSCSEDVIPRLNFTQNMNDAYACNGTVGQDFLTWLLYISEAEGGMIDQDAQFGGPYGLGVDGPLLFVADGKGALESVVRKGLPTQSAEGQAALNVGKKLKQAKLLFGRGEDIWAFTFDSDLFAFRSLKLPDGEMLEPESAFQERVMNIGVIQNVLGELFHQYVETVRDSGRFEELQRDIKRWVDERMTQFGDL